MPSNQCDTCIYRHYIKYHDTYNFGFCHTGWLIFFLSTKINTENFVEVRDRYRFHELTTKIITKHELPGSSAWNSHVSRLIAWRLRAPRGALLLTKHCSLKLRAPRDGSSQHVGEKLWSSALTSLRPAWDKPSPPALHIPAKPTQDRGKALLR